MVGMAESKNNEIGRKVLLVGHCGPDSSYLKMAVRSARSDAAVVYAEDAHELRAALDGGVDLILFNRELGYGFDEKEGVDIIRWLKPNYPTLKMMLVSNYADAQKAAVEAGALPGFGKRELGQPRIAKLLREALNEEEE